MTTTYIHGGHLVDPVSRTISKGDVLIRDDTVAAVGELSVPEGAGVSVVQADGLYVCPGFVDIHTHVLHHVGEAGKLVDADRVGVRQGVGCLVDAGSSGAATIEKFVGPLAAQRTPTYLLVNIGSPGTPGTEGGHSSRPELVSLAATVRAVERHRDRVRGIKVQASNRHTGAFGVTAVALARKAADLTGLPLMMHIGNAPPVLDEALPYLRAGDVLTHAYHGKVGGVLTRDPRRGQPASAASIPGGDVPLPALTDAIDRGVIVDVGHGSASFSFAVAERALALGLPVHTISTDLHRGNLDRVVISLARTMTKLLHLGLPLADAVAAVTVAPARALRLDADGFGTLAPGRPAHLTLFRLRAEPVDLQDAEGEVRRAEEWLQPVGVYVAGTRFDVDAPL